MTFQTREPQTAPEPQLKRWTREEFYELAAGVAEYWIVNLGESQIEVHRDPVRGETRYENTPIARATEILSPIAHPQVRLAVSELFT